MAKLIDGKLISTQIKDELREQTTLLKQQLEGQIEVLKEQINTARMNDEHLAQRSIAIVQDLL